MKREAHAAHGGDGHGNVTFDIPLEFGVITQADVRCFAQQPREREFHKEA